MLLLRAVLWNIQAKGQYANWDVTNAFIAAFLFFKTHVRSNSSYYVGVLTFFVQRLFMWSSKECFESKVIPSSSSYFQMALLSILALTLPFSENSIWLFPLFISMHLKSNHLKKNFKKGYWKYSLWNTIKKLFPWNCMQYLL